MTKFIITRHGQTEWNVQKRMQGQADSPLTPLGRQQAAALGKRLAGTEFAAAYCSTLQRTIVTANLILEGRGATATPLPSLMEINIGGWSGKLLSEVEAQYPQEASDFWSHPERYAPCCGGETYKQLRDRASQTMLELAKAHPCGTVLVVTHGIVLKALYNFFRYQPLADMAQNHPHPKSCCYCEVDFHDGVFYIAKWNDTAHYEFITDQQ